MNPGGSAKSLTRFGLGARGIDVVSRTTSSGSQVSYPIYDGHGNNVGSLLKNGASFTVADEKTYDAWGALRSGGGADKGKYCASIGHKQDDESGLVYMRARYYEPTSGRFISQDSAFDGMNWFTYCGNQPITKSDRTGKVGLNDGNDLDNLIREVLKAFNIELPPTPKIATMVLAYFEKIALIAAIAGVCKLGMEMGLAIGAASVGTANPFMVGCGGALMGVGMVGLVYCAIAAAIVTRNFLCEMWIEIGNSTL
jgi:RHS repeat-associated protein